MDTYKKMIWVSTIVVSLLIIPLIIYFFFIKEEPSGKSPVPLLPERRAAASPAEKVIEKEEPPQLPADDTVLDIDLNSSDEPVRELLTDCSSHPEFNRWLKAKGLIRRGVAIIDNIADGVNPSAHLGFLAPPGEFKVIKRNGNIYLDPQSYIRYQPVVMAFVSIQTEKAVEYYRLLRPVIEEAYKELGYPGKRFPEVLDLALEVLLETPVIEGDILLEEKVRTYAFANPRLETLTDAQKLLLRMGPENTRKVKDKLQEIAKALKN